MGDGEVDRHVPPTLPGDEQDVSRSLAVAAADFLCRGDGACYEDLEDGITQGVVTACAAVLVTADKVVAEWVHWFIAQGATRESLAYGQKRQA
jgi:hypothetical protein